jgi:hypothetical protein
MNLDNLLNTIESSEFDANINILSGFNTMLRAMENDDVLNQLIVELRESPDKKRRVFERLLELLPQNPHPQYAHPRDVAVAAYLYSLQQIDGELGHRAAEHVLQTPRFWWAGRLAQYILETSIADPR